MSWRGWIMTGGPPPPSAEARFDAAFGPSAWSWSDCRRWADETAATEAATPFLDRLARALAERDVPWILDASAPKIADMAAALPNLDEAAIRAALSAQIGGVSIEPVPRSRGGARPRLCADGRLLSLSDRDGGPLHKGRSGDGRVVAFSAMIGETADGWRIVR